MSDSIANTQIEGGVMHGAEEEKSDEFLRGRISAYRGVCFIAFGLIVINILLLGLSSAGILPQRNSGIQFGGAFGMSVLLAAICWHWDRKTLKDRNAGK